MGPPETSLDLPEVIEVDGDSFDVLTVLGRGGMGVVYKARQHSFDRVVALKMLQAGGFADAEAVIRLRREAITAASIKHPNIVSVHSFGMYGNAPYIVMEYVEGQTLSERLQQQRKLPPAEVTAIFNQILDALQAIHQAGLVHRDLKPSNIIVTTDGTAKLMDFGIAKQFTQGAAQRLTQTGAMLGTPAYMSPEQCASGKVDPRSDIYSLGCTMYHALSGREPFSAESAMEVMLKHMNEQATTAGSDPVLDNAIAKAMEKNPDDRFQTALQFKEAINATQPGTHRRRKLSRNWNKRATLYIVASVVCALLLALFLVTSSLRPIPEDADSTISTAEDSPAEFAESAGVRLNALEAEFLHAPNRANYLQEVSVLTTGLRDQLKKTEETHNYALRCILLDAQARAVGLYDPERSTKLWSEVLNEADRVYAHNQSPQQWDRHVERYLHALGFFARHAMRKEFESAAARANGIIAELKEDNYFRHRKAAEIYRLRGALEDASGDHAQAARHLRNEIDEREIWEQHYTPERALAYCSLCKELQDTQQWKEITKIVGEQLTKTTTDGLHGDGLKYMRESIATMQSQAALAWLNLGDTNKSNDYMEKSMQMRAEVGQPRQFMAVAMIEHAIALHLAGDKQAAYQWGKRAYDLAGPLLIANPDAWPFHLTYIRIAVEAGHADQVRTMAQELVPIAHARNELQVVVKELETVAAGTVAGGTQK